MRRRELAQRRTRLFSRHGIDDRGRLVPLARRRLFRFHVPNGHTLSREATVDIRNALNDQLRHNRTAHTFRAFVGLSLIALLPLTMYGLKLTAPALLSTLSLPAAATLVILTLPALLFGCFVALVPTTHAPSLMEALLSLRRCPSCTHDLTGCLRATDRCTVCPECGAAWKLPPPQHP